MRTHPSVALVVLLFAGAGCSTDPGPSGSAGGCASCTDASAPATQDATVHEASAPDAGEAPEVGPPDAAPDAAPGPRLNVLAIGHLVDADGTDDIHAPFVRAATTWLKDLATQKGFTFDSVVDPNAITDDSLKPYDVILQLNYTPFDWSTTAEAAFEKYMTEGRGGWVGLHHAALYGPDVQPEGQAPWTWFYDFIGQINYVNYIASFASAQVVVEEAAHPIFAGVPSPFVVTTDEWYQWDKSPRPHVHVLAHVDESSYKPPSNIKMGGDHPVIWSNDAYKARNLYIFMGHHPNLFQNAAYVTLLQNAIFWAAGKSSQ